MTDEDVDPEFESLLDFLRESRGFDFSGYKRSSLMRRMSKRMQAVGVKSYGEYVDYLQVHPDEFAQLFDYILINVTGFFRDPAIWDYLSSEVVPRIAASKGPEDPIRAWSAGSASGEEAYSLAVVLAEAVGLEAIGNRVKVYGTDVDEGALARARQAVYTAKEVDPVPPALLDAYFEQNGTSYSVRWELRRAVIFGRHDLVQDAPISKVDLLVCRNTLMYFNTEAQARIMRSFHFALNDGGFLLLGKAEMLFSHSRYFVPVDLRRRVFTKAPSEAGGADRLQYLDHAEGAEGSTVFASHMRSREAAIDAAPVAQVVVDASGYLALANARARQMFGLTQRDMGRPFSEAELSYRPVELRSRIHQVAVERSPAVVEEVEWSRNGDPLYLRVHLTPLIDPANHLLGVSVSFDDVTPSTLLQRDLERANQELETAMEELQSTNEELETTNEELQSTNEELETMNEELQSTNEELQAANEQLRERGSELDQANVFLGSILEGVQAGVIVVDRDQRVLLWNERSQDLWGLRAEEVRGRSVVSLDIGLPVDLLGHAIRSCLDGSSPREEVTVSATNRRGKTITCRVTCTPMGTEATPLGVILLVEDEPAG